MNTNRKPEVELPEWDRAAIAYAKARAREDGQIGFVMRAGDEADQWEAYFKWKGLRSKAGFMRFHVNNGGAYTVPTQFPYQFDPAFRGVKREPKPAPKAEKPTPMEDRLKWWDK